jgi:hypothetical protein
MGFSTPQFTFSGQQKGKAICCSEDFCLRPSLKGSFDYVRPPRIISLLNNLKANKIRTLIIFPKSLHLCHII